MQIRLKIHSFIDIITNSSTEIFVAATENTVKSVKQLVDALLAVGGSNLTSDDLFTYELVNSSYSDRLSYWEVELRYAKEQAEREGYEFDEEEFLEDYPMPDKDADEYGDDVDLLVTLRSGVEETPQIKTALEVMSRLSRLFHVGEKMS